MKKDETTIDEMIRRFFDGETTNPEEAELKAYFSGDTVPDRLLGYKPVFLALGADLRPVLDAAGPGCAAPVRTRKTGRVLSVLAAASVALLLGLFAYDSFVKAYDPYEGTRLVVNGEAVTDPELARARIDEAMSLVLEIERDVDDALANISIVEDNIRQAFPN